jgi:hypothetical protein
LSAENNIEPTLHFEDGVLGAWCDPEGGRPLTDVEVGILAGLLRRAGVLRSSVFQGAMRWEVEIRVDEGLEVEFDRHHGLSLYGTRIDLRQTRVSDDR